MHIKDYDFTEEERQELEHVSRGMRKITLIGLFATMLLCVGVVLMVTGALLKH